MPFPSETYVNQIQDPAVRAEFQQLYSLFQGYLSAQHKDSGAHSAITADSLTATGEISTNGNVTASAASTPVVIGTQFPVLPSASEARGLLIGPSTDGLALVRRFKGSHFGGSGTYSLALFDLAQSSTIPVLEFALDSGVPTLVDGGTGSTAPAFGNANRPLASVVASHITLGGSLLGEWATFSPTWTNLTVGNGTVTAKYMRVGLTTWVDVFVVFGTTTTVGGNIQLTGLPTNNANLGSAYRLGDLAMLDANVNATYTGAMMSGGATTANPVTNATPAAAVSATVPFTWAVSDQLHISLVYREV